jgi:hypothetical protein
MSAKQRVKGEKRLPTGLLPRETKQPKVSKRGTRIEQVSKLKLCRVKRGQTLYGDLLGSETATPKHDGDFNKAETRNLQRWCKQLISVFFGLGGERANDSRALAAISSGPGRTPPAGLFWSQRG